MMRHHSCCWQAMVIKFKSGAERSSEEIIAPGVKMAAEMNSMTCMWNGEAISCIWSGEALSCMQQALTTNFNEKVSRFFV